VRAFSHRRSGRVRIPDAGRFELRLPDRAANPHVMQAAILAAGLDGIEMKRDPGKRLAINMYTEGHTVGDVQRLPLNLLDAIRALEQSDVMTKSFGEFVPAYLKLKKIERNDYARHLTEWERDTTMDC
jgi:glutamate---methylamine ligase